MAGRALVFSNADVVQLVNQSFVPYAGDQWYLHRRNDADGAYFWKVAQEGHYKASPKEATRQGVYIAAADGSLLGSSRFDGSPARTLTLMRESLARFSGTSPASHLPEPSGDDREYRRVPPVGGLILKAYSRIPRQKPAGEKWNRNDGIGRDHLWLTRSEWRALAPRRWEKGLRYPVPPAILERLCRFHLVDNVRGEPDIWHRTEIRQAELWLTVVDSTGRLELNGVARLRADGRGQRGYEPQIQGTLQFDRAPDRITRCDLLAWGDAWGESQFTQGAPPGRFPLHTALTLAGHSPADRVPPQGARHWDSYFGAAG